MPKGDGLLNHDLLPGDKGPQDACGVFGVWAPGEEVSKLTYFGLYALQHRGQESAGIAVSDGDQIVVYKDMGLVSQVFNEGMLELLLPAYVAEGKSYLSIAIGCTGGQHRSVAMVEHLSHWFMERSMHPRVTHRDMPRH